MTIHNIRPASPAQSLAGPLTGLTTGQPQSWGLLDVVPLLPTGLAESTGQFVAPLQHLHLVRVRTYGTLELQNTANEGLLIAPMHIGFFQSGAQNHATSRVLLLPAGKRLIVEDCFCIQQSQSGYLAEAQQRFIVLPLGLRRPALLGRREEDFSRLWKDIAAFNRRYGITRGGHLERFLRPNFHRLLPLRHAFETLPRQVGAAYFVAGRLVGVEVGPDPAYWSDVGPILTMYCYGAAALQAERHKLQSARTLLNLHALTSLDELAQRLSIARQQDERAYLQELETLGRQSWRHQPEEKQQKLQVTHLVSQEWMGQSVQTDDRQIVYLSIFRDLKD